MSSATYTVNKDGYNKTIGIGVSFVRRVRAFYAIQWWMQAGGKRGRECIQVLRGIDSNINNVKYCQECFSFDMPSDLSRKRVANFECKFTAFYLKV